MREDGGSPVDAGGEARCVRQAERQAGALREPQDEAWRSQACRGRRRDEECATGRAPGWSPSRASGRSLAVPGLRTPSASQGIGNCGHNGHIINGVFPQS